MANAQHSAQDMEMNRPFRFWRKVKVFSLVELVVEWDNAYRSNFFFGREPGEFEFQWGPFYATGSVPFLVARRFAAERAEEEGN